MEGSITTLLILGAMAAVVLLFRVMIRRPRRASQQDPPGVRTMAVFSGDDREFFQDDPDGGMLVGIRLFQKLCDGLAAERIRVENRGTIQNAQRAECVVDEERFALVLEWIDGVWAASVEWVPRTAAEKRHLALTQQVFAPSDGPALRRLLAALDRWLKAQAKLTDLKWHHKEKWIAEDTSDPADEPFDSAAHDFS